jgi:L-fuconolactonase
MHRGAGPVAFRPVGETEVGNAVAVLSASGAYGKPRACAGIVAFADLRSTELDAVLDAHDAAGGGHFRGIRHSAALNAFKRIAAGASATEKAVLFYDTAARFYGLSV